MMDNSFTQADDARVELLLGLYVQGVFDFEQVGWWAVELGMDDVSRRRLMRDCVEWHFSAPRRHACRLERDRPRWDRGGKGTCRPPRSVSRWTSLSITPPPPSGTKPLNGIG